MKVLLSALFLYVQNVYVVTNTYYYTVINLDYTTEKKTLLILIETSNLDTCAPFFLFFYYFSCQPLQQVSCLDM